MFHAVFVSAWAGNRSLARQCQAPLAVAVPNVGFGHVWTHPETPYCTFSIDFQLSVGSEKNGKMPGRTPKRTGRWFKFGVKQLLKHDDTVHHIAFTGAKVAVCFDLQFFTTSQGHP